LFNQSQKLHITPLVINSLGGGHTHTQTSRTKVISRNQARAGLWPARAWFKKLTKTYWYIYNNTKQQKLKYFIRYIILKIFKFSTISYASLPASSCKTQQH